MKNKATKPGTFVDYWERTVPWTFRGEGLSYNERRRRRYSLQDYMLNDIPFKSYKGKRVLEVGSGGGVDSSEFGRSGAEVVSLDFTQKGARSSLETLAEAGVASSDVVRAAAQHLPFRDGVFDSVYSFGVLHHIPDAKKVVKQIARVLNRTGELICMVYNRNSLLYAYSILFLHQKPGATEAQLVSRYSERVEGCPYTKAYTKEDVDLLLVDDFQGISAVARYNVIDTLSQRKVKVEVGDSYELGWHLIVKARKKRQ